MNEVDRFLTGVSAVWASVKMHELASLLFSHLYGSPLISLTINWSVIGNIAFAIMMLVVTSYMIRKDPGGRESVLWLLSASLILGIPVAILQGLVGISVGAVLGILALGTALLAYCWTIWCWSKVRKDKFRGRLLGAAGIVLMMIIPIGISWAAAYTGVLT